MLAPFEDEDLSHASSETLHTWCRARRVRPGASVLDGVDGRRPVRSRSLRRPALAIAALRTGESKGTLETVPHITADELVDALAGDQPPLLLDLRGPVMRAETGPIAGAVATDLDHLHDAVAAWLDGKDPEIQHRAAGAVQEQMDRQEEREGRDE